MKRATLTLVVCALLVPVAVGQATFEVTPVSGITYGGTYNVATGTIMPPSGADECVVVYNNTADNGYFWTAGVGAYGMDWGTLAAAPNNEICALSFAYATNGPDADVIIRVHEGATGFGNPGVVVAAFLLTGLPGSPDPLSVAAFAFDVDLTGSEFLLADGPVGYSFEYDDNFAGPLLAGPPNEAGVENAFDIYASDGTYIQTGWFGGTPMASFWFALWGQEPLAVDLMSMSATYGEGAVNVCWTTGSEVDNAGFKVQRALTPYGPFRAVTGLIPAAGGPSQTTDYCTLDETVHIGPTPWYRLQDINIHGVSTFHDPVRTAEWPDWRKLISGTGSTGFGLR